MKKLTTTLALAGFAACAALPGNAQVHYTTNRAPLARVAEILEIAETVVRIIDPASVVVVQQPAPVVYQQVVYATPVVYAPPPPVVIRQPVVYYPPPPVILRPPVARHAFPPPATRPAPQPVFRGRR